MSEPISFHSCNELKYFLMASPCENCGKGPGVIQEMVPAEKPDQPGLARATCRACKSGRIIRFFSEYELPDADSPCISPVDEPSGAVDLDQWLGIYYQLAEEAERAEDRRRSHALTVEASLCLAEALKFYGPDEELPPETAFFSETTQAAFREHPQNFTRQLLEKLQSKLPPPPRWGG